MEGCEFLGILRSEKLLAFNPHQWVMALWQLIQVWFALLDNLQTADLNGDEERKATLLLELKGKSVIAEIGENGAVSYRVMHGGLDVDEAIRRRLAARKAKNWAEADRIRDELAAMGIALKDAKTPKPAKSSPPGRSRGEPEKAPSPGRVAASALSREGRGQIRRGRDSLPK